MRCGSVSGVDVRVVRAERSPGNALLEEGIARFAIQVEDDPRARRALDERSAEDVRAEVVPSGLSPLLGIATSVTIETEYGLAPRELSGRSFSTR